MEARYTRLVQEEEEGSGHALTGQGLYVVRCDVQCPPQVRWRCWARGGWAGRWCRGCGSAGWQLCGAPAPRTPPSARCPRWRPRSWAGWWWPPCPPSPGPSCPSPASGQEPSSSTPATEHPPVLLTHSPRLSSCSSWCPPAWPWSSVSTPCPPMSWRTPQTRRARR